MPSLSKSIIINVEERYIETYLRTKKHILSDDKQGQELKYWVDDLLKENKINIVEFEQFLFDELFFGKRKTIKIYKLDQVKNYKYPVDWEKVLQEKYGIDSINFSSILDSIPSEDEPRRIAAVHSIENSRGELTKIQILFACYIQVAGKREYNDCVSYIPVEIDFVRKIMLIKAWTRQQIALEEYKADYLMNFICDLMKLQFNVCTKDFSIEHKKVLFEMSRSLIYEAYSHVPTYNQINKLNGNIKGFIQNILKELPLKNAIVDEEGQCTIPEGVLQFEAEIRNVIESLAISDYFFEKNFEEIWQMGLEAVVARIKFNDQEKVLTSLSGENTEMPIFCTKTFMSLKNRMEESEKIETLWITMERKKGNLNLKFDATNTTYLEVLVRYGIRFNENDMHSALEIYEKYETKINQKVAKQSKIAIGQ